MKANGEDVTAKDTIIASCEINIIDEVTWYDTEDLCLRSSLAWEIKYLRMRGLLIHHPMVPRLVRFKE